MRKYRVLDTTLRTGGFTLVEVLLYVSLMGILLGAISLLFVLMLQARADHEAVAEVEGQGAHAMQAILQVTRDAQGILGPATSSPSSTLTLAVTTSTLSPTVFELSTGTIRMREGSFAPTMLTTNRVAISNLTFQNLTRPNTSGTVRIEFIVDYESSSTIGRSAYQKTFIGSATLR
jgi:type II secretory pathway pseudopilin PulG